MSKCAEADGEEQSPKAAKNAACVINVFPSGAAYEGQVDQTATPPQKAAIIGM